MLNSLKNFFKEPDDEANKVDSDLHILCGLMIEAANIDGILEQSEIDKIHQILVETFNEDSNLIRRLAGLLYISDFECGKTRKKVLAKLNIKE